PRGAGVRRRRRAADAAALQGAAELSAAAQRSDARDGGEHGGPGPRIHRVGAGALAWRHHLARPGAEQPDHAGAAAAQDGGVADAAALDGARSRALLAAEEAAALTRPAF